MILLSKFQELMIVSLTDQGHEQVSSLFALDRLLQSSLHDLKGHIQSSGSKIYIHTHMDEYSC